MALPRTERERKRRAFLHALAAGRSVVEAADHAGIAWSTLYTWRHSSAAFGAAWDRAAERARNALMDRMQAALVQRAVEGVDEPVFHAGERVGSRKRYSDALLLAGLRELTMNAPSVPGSIAAAEPDAPDKRKRVTVVIQRFDDDRDSDEDPGPPKPAALVSIEPPAPPPAEPVPATPPPDPASAPALRWDHLTTRDADEKW